MEEDFISGRNKSSPIPLSWHLQKGRWNLVRGGEAGGGTTLDSSAIAP